MTGLAGADAARSDAPRTNRHRMNAASSRNKGRRNASAMISKAPNRDVRGTSKASRLSSSVSKLNSKDRLIANAMNNSAPNKDVSGNSVVRKKYSDATLNR